MEEKSKCNEKLEIRRMRLEDIDEVVQLFAYTFSKYEPLSVHLHQDLESFLPFAVKATKRCSKEPLSFICEDIALEDGQRIVGFCLNETLHLNEMHNETQETDNHGTNDDNDQIQAFLKQLGQKWLNATKIDSTTKLFHLATVGVRNDYNNRGIATKLISASLNNAKLANFDVVVVEATAIATQRIFKHKYEFHEVVSALYDTFVFNGKRVFKGLKTPESAIVFEKELKDWCPVQINELIETETIV